MMELVWVGIGVAVGLFFGWAGHEFFYARFLRQANERTWQALERDPGKQWANLFGKAIERHDEERRSLLRLIMDLRMRGETAGPEHFDDHWGRYVMGTEEGQAVERKAEDESLSRAVQDELDRGAF